MRAETTVLSIARSTERPIVSLVAALDRASLKADRCPSGLYRLRSPSGRTVYVEERPHGASGRASWVVHADAFGGEPSRQIPCPTIARVLIAIRASLAGDPNPAVLDGRPRRSDALSPSPLPEGAETRPERLGD